MEQNHITAVYVNHAARQFSVTSRAASNSNWEGIDKVEAERGFTRLNIAEGMSKNDADSLKECIIAGLGYHAGYMRVSRKQV